MASKRKVILIAHNIRSAHNVGSILRTAEGFGLQMVYLTGYSPHPGISNDDRLPHHILKLTNQINKTALGAEKSQEWRFNKDVSKVVADLKLHGYTVAALEQSTKSQNLTSYNAPLKIALLVGREVEGVEKEVLELCDIILEIPMAGQKESYNVAQAASMALYQLTLFS